MAEKLIVDTVKYVTSEDGYRYEVKERELEIVQIQYQEFGSDRLWKNEGASFDLPLETLKMICKCAEEVVQSNAANEGTA